MFKKLFMTIIFGFVAFANPLEINSSIEKISINDQFGTEHILNKDIKTILFASDKKSSEVLKDYLLSKEGDILSKNSAIYVADISGMPSLITKFVALPKMKKYPFLVFLLDEKNKDYFTKDEGKIIVYSVQKGKVKNITKISTSKELENIIK